MTEGSNIVLDNPDEKKDFIYLPNIRKFFPNKKGNRMYMLFALQLFVDDTNSKTDLEFKILFLYYKKLWFKNSSRRTVKGLPFALVKFKMSELKQFVDSENEDNYNEEGQNDYILQ